MVSVSNFIPMVILLLSMNAMAKPTPADCKHPTVVDEEVGAIMEVAANLPAGGCADSTKLVGICDAIYKKWDGPKGTDYDYMYEKMIHDASCVKPGEPETMIAKKVQGMWNKLEDPYLKCNQANFDVSRGSILKYSLSQKNYDFLGLAVEVWKVNLNAVDKNDNRTLLDYVKSERDRLKGTKYEEKLNDYYDFLRENGAKHKSELW